MRVHSTIVGLRCGAHGGVQQVKHAVRAMPAVLLVVAHTVVRSILAALGGLRRSSLNGL